MLNMSVIASSSFCCAACIYSVRLLSTARTRRRATQRRSPRRFVNSCKSCEQMQTTEKFLGQRTGGDKHSSCHRHTRCIKSPIIVRSRCRRSVTEPTEHRSCHGAHHGIPRPWQVVALSARRGSLMISKHARDPFHGIPRPPNGTLPVRHSSSSHAHPPPGKARGTAHLYARTYTPMARAQPRRVVLRLSPRFLTVPCTSRDFRSRDFRSSSELAAISRSVER